MRTIKGNLKREEELKEHRREPWRATGRTTRALFDLASRHPHGEYYFVCHSGPMRDMAMRQFIDMQIYSGAPITVNNQRKAVKLHSAVYRFVVESRHFRKRAHPDATILEDHYVQEERNHMMLASLEAEQRWLRDEEAREYVYKTTKD